MTSTTDVTCRQAHRVSPMPACKSSTTALSSGGPKGSARSTGADDSGAEVSSGRSPEPQATRWSRPPSHAVTTAPATALRHAPRAYPTAAELRKAADDSVAPQVFSLVRSGQLPAAKVLMRAYGMSPDATCNGMTLDEALERSTAPAPRVAEFRETLARLAQATGRRELRSCAVPEAMPVQATPVQAAATEVTAGGSSAALAPATTVAQDAPAGQPADCFRGGRPRHPPVIGNFRPMIIPSFKGRRAGEEDLEDPKPVGPNLHDLMNKRRMDHWKRSTERAMQAPEIQEPVPVESPTGDDPGPSVRHRVKRGCVDPVLRTLFAAAAKAEQATRCMVGLFVAPVDRVPAARQRPPGRRWEPQSRLTTDAG